MAAPVVTGSAPVAGGKRRQQDRSAEPAPDGPVHRRSAPHGSGGWQRRPRRRLMSTSRTVRPGSMRTGNARHGFVQVGSRRSPRHQLTMRQGLGHRRRPQRPVSGREPFDQEPPVPIAEGADPAAATAGRSGNAQTCVKGTGSPSRRRRPAIPPVVERQPRRGRTSEAPIRSSARRKIVRVRAVVCRRTPKS